VATKTATKTAKKAPAPVVAKIEAEYGIKMKRFDIAWEIKNDAGNKAWSDITKILAKRK